MPLLEGGRLVADRFAAVADDAPLPDDAPALVTLARLRAFPELLSRRALLGVRVGPGTQPADLAALLPHLALVAVEFPKFRDGRGFSLARALREQHGFAGEIRAVGHVLPDQHRFLLRCGFSSVEVPEGADLAPWTTALDRFHLAYQTAISDPPLRARLRPGAMAFR
jgi:uncharacterized protein (DUF934 family)